MVKGDFVSHKTTDAQETAIRNLSRALGIEAEIPKRKEDAADHISRLIKEASFQFGKRGYNEDWSDYDYYDEWDWWYPEMGDWGFQ